LEFLPRQNKTFPVTLIKSGGEWIIAISCDLRLKQLSFLDQHELLQRKFGNKAAKQKLAQERN